MPLSPRSHRAPKSNYPSASAATDVVPGMHFRSPEGEPVRYTARELRYSLAELEQMPTLATGQTDDLKVDTGASRVWLARTSIEDGESYNNRVTIEDLVDGQWVIVQEYPAERCCDC
jgi:hypothetical protein